VAEWQAFSALPLAAASTATAVPTLWPGVKRLYCDIHYPGRLEEAYEFLGYGFRVHPQALQFSHYGQKHATAKRGCFNYRNIRRLPGLR
jgi:hypothetical protein